MQSPLMLSREQVRRVDALAIDRYGISGLVLMENAGRGVVDVLLKVDRTLRMDRFQVHHTSPPAPLQQGEGGGEGVVVLCGKGNNAGDGFVIARHLAIRGVQTKTLLLFPPDQLTGDARANLEILARSGEPLIDISASSVEGRLDEHATGAAWLIDAMLGTGAQGEPRAPIAQGIDWINAQAARRLAVDLPSGLDCDTGEPASVTVRADLTCTFVAMKPGFVMPMAKPYLGEVHVVDIGVPPRLVREAAGA